MSDSADNIVPSYASSEFERRKQVIARGETDVERWSNPGQLETAWDQRAQLAGDFLPAGATVLDLGCGRMALERYLPMGCTYIPCDVVARDARTTVCDFNKGELPPLGEATHVTLLGVLEYLYDLPAFLRHLRTYERTVVVSYNPTDFTGGIDRPALGWVNHWSEQQLTTALQEAGFSLQTRSRIDATQVLLRLSPQPKKAFPTARVVVLSAFNASNFGDRLGYHLVNEVLPGYATVCHAFFNRQNDFRPDNLPPGEFDLLILGMGNSLFDGLLTDDLFRLLEQAPRIIGIFGTQYRGSIDARRLGRVLDRLDTWYARNEEDILLYGRSRSNAVHLGDWLISACPMGWGTNPQTLAVSQGLADEVPLDRTIQQVQAHRYVWSPRLGPLLCALTSAEQVAYREQREHASGEPSGKFRSMLLDIFGRTYSEDQFFEVNREAVADYKVKVQKGMAEMRSRLAAVLSKAK